MLLPMLRENNSALTDVQKKKKEENSDGFPLTYKISNMCKGLLKNKQKISLTHFVLDEN